MCTVGSQDNDFAFMHCVKVVNEGHCTRLHSVDALHPKLCVCCIFCIMYPYTTEPHSVCVKWAWYSCSATTTSTHTPRAHSAHAREAPIQLCLWWDAGRLALVMSEFMCACVRAHGANLHTSVYLSDESNSSSPKFRSLIGHTHSYRRNTPQADSVCWKGSEYTQSRCAGAVGAPPLHSSRPNSDRKREEERKRETGRTMAKQDREHLPQARINCYRRTHMLGYDVSLWSS